MKTLVMAVLVANLVTVAAPMASAQQVWKCRVGSEVRYSDQPCRQDGQPLPPQALQPNLVDAVKRPPAASATLPGPEPITGTPNACPSDSELRGWETRASSNSYGPDEKQFLQDEIRRARLCRKGQGRYDNADWDISRRAQEAQSSLTGGSDARRRAEGMHSAADPEEGQRIASRRQQEDADRRRAEAAAARQRQNLPASSPR